MNQRLLSAGILLLAACAKKDAPPPAPPALQEVTFTATEFAFTGPDSIAPGVTAIHLVNRGTQNHNLILGHLADGKTMQDMMDFMKVDSLGDPPWLTWRGSASGLVPQGTNTTIADLPAGHYVAICYMPDPADGRPHVTKGMIKEFVVAGPRGEAPAPAADVEVRASDYTFTVPALGTGAHTIHFINDGPTTHELQLIRLNDGATMQSFMASMAPGSTTPPAGVFLGGGGGLSRGGDNYWKVTLEPGRYLLVCFVPDPDGVPHAMKGMIQELTISS